MKEKKEISVYFANWNLDRLPAEQAGEVAGIPWDCVQKSLRFSGL